LESSSQQRDVSVPHRSGHVFPPGTGLVHAPPAL
jgi:hypothetical protein